MNKFYRANNKVISGVCGGLAQYFEMDVLLIRILFIILLFTPFPIILLYLLMWILTPSNIDD